MQHQWSWPALWFLRMLRLTSRACRQVLLLPLSSIYILGSLHRYSACVYRLRQGSPSESSQVIVHTIGYTSRILVLLNWLANLFEAEYQLIQVSSRSIRIPEEKGRFNFLVFLIGRKNISGASSYQLCVFHQPLERWADVCHGSSQWQPGRHHSAVRPAQGRSARCDGSASTARPHVSPRDWR